jgi:hypothetical protein
MRHNDGKLAGFADRLQLADGKSWIQKVYPRDNGARIYRPYHISDGEEFALVEYILPVVEAVFRILGPDGALLTLAQMMDGGFS